jgi:hypothetical protein
VPKRPLPAQPPPRPARARTLGRTGGPARSLHRTTGTAPAGHRNQRRTGRHPPGTRRTADTSPPDLYTPTKRAQPRHRPPAADLPVGPLTRPKPDDLRTPHRSEVGPPDKDLIGDRCVCQRMGTTVRSHAAWQVSRCLPGTGGRAPAAGPACHLGCGCDAARQVVHGGHGEDGIPGHWAAFGPDGPGLRSCWGAGPGAVRSAPCQPAPGWFRRCRRT